MTERRGGILSFPRELADRFSSPPLTDLECIITATAFRPTADDCRHAAEECAKRLVSRHGVEPATEALSHFIERLFHIPQVEGVAFLTVREETIPTSLSIGVFAPLDRHNDDTGQLIGSIAQAKARLGIHLTPLVPIGLRYFNTLGSDITTMKHQLATEWASDPMIELVRFVTYQRGRP